MIILSTINYSVSTNINCTYESDTHWMVGDKYSCKVQKGLIIDSPKKAQIQLITGNHMRGKTSNDGIYFYSKRNIFQYFPTGLQKHFSSLLGIYITYGQMKSIHQKDLQLYSKLELLDLYNNEIEVIEDNLFKFNPNLVAISFHSNNIFHISYTAFSGLTELSSLSMGSNICVDIIVEKNVSKVVENINTLLSACNHQNYQKIENEFKNLNNWGSNFMENLQSLNFELRNSSLMYSNYVQEKLMMISSITLSILLNEKPKSIVVNQEILVASINNQISKLEQVIHNKSSTNDDSMTSNYWMWLITCFTSLIHICIIILIIKLHYYRI